MSQTVPVLHDAPTVRPPAVSLGEAWPWLAFLAVMLLAISIVGFEEGAGSILPGSGIHEFVHDGRHLLGFPCH